MCLFLSYGQKMAGINKHSEHGERKIDLVTDIFISAPSLCFCTLMENALMQTEGVRCTQGTAKRACFAKVRNIFNCMLFTGRT